MDTVIARLSIRFSIPSVARWFFTGLFNRRLEQVERRSGRGHDRRTTEFRLRQIPIFSANDNRFSDRSASGHFLSRTMTES